MQNLMKIDGFRGRDTKTELPKRKEDFLPLHIDSEGYNNLLTFAY